MIFLWIAVACTPDKQSDSGTQIVSTENGWSASVSLSEFVETAVNIDLEINGQGSAWATATTDRTTLQTLPYEIDDKGQLTILGLLPGEEAEVAVTVSKDGLEETLPSMQITAGQLPNLVQSINITINAPAPDPGGYFMGTLFGQPEFLAIWDTSGQILWAVRQYDDAHGGIDSRIGRDGKSIYFNRFSKDKTIDDGAIHQIKLDGSPIAETPTPMGHHIFTELPDNSLVYIELDLRETDDYGAVCGDSLIKISPNGDTETIFSVWDHLPVTESRFFYNSFYPQCKDWTHGNFIDYDENRDSILFATAGTDIIFEISQDGTLLRTFGGQTGIQSDYELIPTDSGFAYPHGVNWSADGDLIMMSTQDDLSTALVFEVNDNDGTLRLKNSFGEGYQHNVRNLGEYKETTDNLKLVNWGSIGRLQLIDMQGHLQWEAYTPLGRWFAQTERLTALPGMQP